MPPVHPTPRLKDTATPILVAAALVAAVVLAMAPAGQGGFHGEMGSFVSSLGDDDYVPFLQDATAGHAFCFGYIEDDDSPNDPAEYAWMFHISNTGDCTGTQSPAAQRTWLITAFGGSTSGAQKWLTSTDTQYTNQDFDDLQEISSAADWLCYLESDGINGYSIGDPVYVKQDFTSTAELEEDDLRIVAVGSSQLAAYSVSVGIVSSSDDDFEHGGESGNDPPSADPSRLPVNRDLECGGFDTKMLNLGSIDATTNSDVFYLFHEDQLTDEFVFPGMVRLTSTSGVSGHGQKVLTANSDNKRVLQILADTELNLVVSHDIGTELFEKTLAIQQTNHPAGSDLGGIRMHDILIKRGDGHGASSPGTLATSAPSSSQIGVGSDINDDTDLESQIYFIDTSPTGVYDPTDPVYIQHPDNTGAGVQEGDIRLNVPGQTAGTSVRNSDSDYLSHKDDDSEFDFTLKLFSERGDTRLPLKSVSNGKFVGAESTWDPSEDPVFITSASSIANQTEARQVWDPDANAGAGGPVNEDLTFDCSDPDGDGPDDFCGESLKSGSLKTTGQKTTWLDDGENDGDRLYWSDDNFLTVGDYRMGHGTESSNHNPAGRQVQEGDADVATGALFQSSGTTLLASVHTTFEHPTDGDIQLYPSFGTRWTESTSGAVANVTEIDFAIARAELGDSGSPLNDVYYLDFSDTSSPADCDFSTGRVLRLLPYEDGDKDAGSFVRSGDTVEVQANKRCLTTNPTDHLGFLDNSPSGLDPNDFIYLNLEEGQLGGSADTTLTSWDARITPVSHGSDSFSAGTQVMSGDSDLLSLGGDSFEGTAKILWWDSNRNDVVDQSDALWLRLRADAGVPAGVPTYMDVRLNGEPASSSGGGGGSSPPSEPSTDPTASFTTEIDGRELTVNGAGSSAISGRNLETYAWDFGDGTTQEGSQSVVTHTYGEEGQYTVRLTVTDSQGETDTTTRTVQTDGYVPPSPPPSDDGDGDGDGDGTDGDDDGTTGDGEEEGSPAIGVVLVLALLGTVLVALRRRQ